MIKHFLSALVGATVAAVAVFLLLSGDRNETASFRQVSDDCPAVQPQLLETNNGTTARNLARADESVPEGETTDGPSTPLSDASTFTELVLELPASDREIVGAFNDTYYGALAFDSQEQLEWMIDHGFPTPEIVVTANSLTTEELKALANSRGGVANDLLFHRMVDEAIDKRDNALAGGITEEAYASTPEAFRELVDLRTQQRQLLASESTFSPYVLHRYYAEYRKDPVAAAASLYIAGQRGDRRHQLASRKRKYALQNNLSPEMLDALATYSTLLMSYSDSKIPME